jgi:RecB family exonuclease
MIKYRKNSKWGVIDFKVNGSSDIEEELKSRAADIRDNRGADEIDIVDVSVNFQPKYENTYNMQSKKFQIVAFYALVFNEKINIKEMS